MKQLSGTLSLLTLSLICLAVETNSGCSRSDDRDDALERIETKVDQIIATLTKQGCTSGEPSKPKPKPEPQTETSCQQIKARLPQSASGLYTISDANGNNKRQVFCNFDTLCGDSGGWTRVALLDMQNSNEKCPTGYKVFTTGSTRACGPNQGNAFRGCITPSVKFSSNGLKYAKVCGRVTGYQIGTMWGVWPRGAVLNNINDAYIDGISLTYGTPRKHLWSFINSDYDHTTDPGACPCATGFNQKVQSFVGDNFFCETARSSGGSSSYVFFHPEPLWDGKDCLLKEASCCKVAGIPWFSRVLSTATSEDIELRICKHWNSYGHPMFGSYEIYVK